MPIKIKTLEELPSLVGRFFREHSEGATVGLSGDLGAGKTTFVRQCIEQIAKAAGRPAPRVTSPTFVLHQSYSDLVPPVEHYDLYRLNLVTLPSLVELGYFETVEICRRARGFVFVEWPEQAESSGLLQLEVQMEIKLEEEARIFEWRRVH